MTARAAMERCYQAWQRQDMQIPLELDEAPAPLPGGLVEPKRPNRAEPRCDPPQRAHTAGPVAAPPAPSSGSAPPPHTTRK